MADEDDEYGPDFERVHHFELAQFKTIVPVFCSFYKQIQLKPVRDYSTYYRHLGNRFSDLAVSFARQDAQFPIFGLDNAVFDRFVGLLASLTLFHFSESSKEVYFRCLDCRGFEFQKISFDAPGIELHGFSGMRFGDLKQWAYTKYQICHGQFATSLRHFVQCPIKFNFVKKYKTLNLGLETHFIEHFFIDFCDAIFHPGVEHVFVECASYESEETAGSGIAGFTLKKLMYFLNYCTHVKTLELNLSNQLDHPRFREHDYVPNIVLEGDPLVEAIRREIEPWIQTTTQLEVFRFSYKVNCMWMMDKILRTVINLADVWYRLSDISVVDDEDLGYVAGSEAIEFYKNCSLWFILSHRDDIMAELCKCEQQVSRAVYQ